MTSIGKIDERLLSVPVFCAAINLQTPIIGLFGARMEQEMVGWRWFLYVGAAMTPSTAVIH